HGLPSNASADGPAGADVRAWQIAADFGSAASADTRELDIAPGPGPLSPASGLPIEIWTEGELCLLHALWRLARLKGAEALRARCLEAAAWHIENTQADN